MAFNVQQLIICIGLINLSHLVPPPPSPTSPSPPSERSDKPPASCRSDSRHPRFCPKPQHTQFRTSRHIQHWPATPLQLPPGALGRASPQPMRWMVNNSSAPKLYWQLSDQWSSRLILFPDVAPLAHAVACPLQAMPSIKKEKKFSLHFLCVRVWCKS